MEELILVVALVALVALVWKPARRFVVDALDARAVRIREELDEAARLREEAQALLAHYQRQLHDGEAQAKKTLERAEEEARRLEQQRREQLEAGVARRLDQAVERIALEEQRAVQEVRARAAELAMLATRRLLADHLDEAQARRLVDGAIDEVGRRSA